MSDWLGAFHFLRPQWLWLLLAVPVIYLCFRNRDDMRAQWRKVIDPELLDHLLVTRRDLWRFRPIHMVCLGIVLGTIGAAGPTWRREQPPFTEDKAPLIIALDLSITMDAIDVDPTRLERAKLKIKDLLKLREGARTALFVYASTSHMVVPLTTDHSIFEMYLDSLSTSLLPPGEKDTGLAIEQSSELMKGESVPGTVLFVTDGIEQRSVGKLKSFVAGSDDDVLILGVGTSRGGPIRRGENQYLADSSGRRVFSRMDVEALKALRGNGISATTVTVDDDDVEWVQRRVQSHLQALQEKNPQTRWIDEGYYLTIPCVLLALLWFRRGWSVRWSSGAVMPMIALFLQVPAANAFHWFDLWLTPDQQGRYYFEKGDYQIAATRFEDPMWKGLSLSRSGSYADAIDQFAMSDSAESWYNQGNAFVHLKKYPEAVHAYEQALERRHPWPDAEENLAIAKSLLPPKPPEEEEGDIPPNLKPDEVKEDDKGKRGKKVVMQQFDPEKMADIWMRNIQTSPADFLRRRFAIEDARERKP